MKIKLENVQISFPALTGQGATYMGESMGKYEVTALLPKGSPQEKAVQEAIKAVGMDAFGKEWAKAKLPLKDGDDKPDYQGYPGNSFLKLTTKKRPVVVGRDRAAYTESEIEDKVYGGCVVNIVGTVAAFQNTYGKFIVVNLGAIQHVGAGERFGGDGESAGVDDFADLSSASEDSIPFDDSNDAPF